MVELVDTLHSGCSFRKDVQVRVLSWVQLNFRFLLLFLFPFFCLTPSFSQQLIIQDTTYHFEYLVSKSATNNPQVVKFLDFYADKTKLGAPFFKYGIDVNITTTKVAPSKYLLQCAVTKQSIQGNKTYLDFDISDQLFPDSVLLELVLHNKKDIKKIRYNERLNQKQTFLSTYAYTDSISNILKPSISAFSPIFGKQWLKNVNSQLQAVEIYQKSDSLIGRWDSIVKKIDLSKTELIPLLDFEMDDILKEVNRFNELNLVQRLNLSEQDPRHIAKRITEINILVGQKQMLLNDYLMHIDQRYIMDARKSKDSGNISQAIYLYNKALSYHRYNVTALNELAKLYCEIGRYAESGEFVKTIFSQTYPQDDSYDKCRETGDLLYKRIINQGNDMLVAQSYAQSIRIFENANVFCDSIREPICNGSHHAGIIKAKTGIYNSYLSVINKALKGNLYNIAQNYLSEAHKYQQQNSSELTDDRELQRIVDIIVSEKIRICYKLIQSKSHLKALSLLENAESIGRLFRPNYKLSELNNLRNQAANGGLKELADKVVEYVGYNNQSAADYSYQKAVDYKDKHMQFITDSTQLFRAKKSLKSLDYKNSIKVGDDLFRANMYQNSIERYAEAIRIQKEYQLEPVKNLDSIIASMSHPLILELLSKSRQYIWGNDFYNATQFYNKAVELSEKSNRTQDSIIATNLAIVKESLQKQQCLFLNSKHSVFYDSYLRLKKQNRYAEAVQLLDSMEVASSMNRFCVMGNSVEKAEAFQMKSVARYQSKMKEARYLLSIKKSGEAISCYYIADSIYAVAKLPLLKLQKESIAELLIFTSDKTILFDVCNILVERMNSQDALTVLKIMRQKGVDSQVTRKLQKAIALNLRAESSGLPTSKSSQLKAYNVKGTWFYYFRSSYLGNPISAWLHN